MKNVIILFLIFGFYNCNSYESSSSIEQIYNLNKGKDFSEFENWTIFLRENESDTYIFDSMPNDKVEARYLVVSKDSLLFKRIFPFQDSIFHSLNAYCSEKQNAKGAFDLDLYSNFKALNVDVISYQQNDSLYLLKKAGIVLLHTKGSTDISTIKQYSNYKKIDANWFYFKE